MSVEVKHPVTKNETKSHMKKKRLNHGNMASFLSHKIQEYRKLTRNNFSIGKTRKGKINYERLDRKLEIEMRLDLDAIFENRYEKHEPKSDPNAQVLNAKPAQRLRHFVVHHFVTLQLTFPFKEFLTNITLFCFP